MHFSQTLYAIFIPDICCKFSVAVERLISNSKNSCISLLFFFIIVLHIMT